MILRENLDKLQTDLHLTYADAEALCALQEAVQKSDKGLRLGITCNSWLIERLLSKDSSNHLSQQIHFTLIDDSKTYKAVEL